MSTTLNIPCPSCFALNRVPMARIADKPTCGRCKASIVVDHPVALDDTTFGRYIERSALPVVVDFWAEWCGPCRAMAPAFAATARARVGAVLFAKVDTDRARQTAAQFRIQSIPTLIAFRDGQEVARQSGTMSQPMLERWLSDKL